MLFFSPQINAQNGQNIHTAWTSRLQDPEGGKTKKPKIIDHRKKENAAEMFFDYLKTTKQPLPFFAENQKTLEFLSKKNLSNAIIINRLNPEKVDQIAFLTALRQKKYSQT